jgi:hypothetical protein
MKMTTGDQQMAAPQQKECQIWQNDEVMIYVSPLMMLFF